MYIYICICIYTYMYICIYIYNTYNIHTYLQGLRSLLQQQVAEVGRGPRPRALDRHTNVVFNMLFKSYRNVIDVSCIYIYIYRERERERFIYIYIYTHICVYIYIYTHIRIHTYIYIYIHIMYNTCVCCLLNVIL